MRASERLGWDLATEPIVVKIRWFGVVMGYILVQSRTGLHDPWAVRAFLALGAGTPRLTRCSTYRLREVVLNRWPLFVSLMESVFIALALLSRHRAGEPVSLVLPALAHLLCDPVPAAGRLADVRLALPEPAGPGRGAPGSIRGRNRACPGPSRSWPG